MESAQRALCNIATLSIAHDIVHGFHLLILFYWRQLVKKQTQEIATLHYTCKLICNFSSLPVQHVVDRLNRSSIPASCRRSKRYTNNINVRYYGQAATCKRSIRILPALNITTLPIANVIVHELPMITRLESSKKIKIKLNPP